MSDQPTVVGQISQAERRVLDELMRDGASNAEIAKRLSLSEQTVKVHVKSLLEQAQCASRTALAVGLFRRRVRLAVLSRPGRGRPPIKHGTPGGYRAHLFREDEPCEPCTEAARAQGRHMQLVRRQRREMS